MKLSHWLPHGHIINIFHPLGPQSVCWNKIWKTDQVNIYFRNLLFAIFMSWIMMVTLFIVYFKINKCQIKQSGKMLRFFYKTIIQYHLAPKLLNSECLSLFYIIWRYIKRPWPTIPSTNPYTLSKESPYLILTINIFLIIK